ncbi:hypothetical protein CALCODRAFT_290841 [Calocera cornea HHB12733]|uniref:Uncharacterized protein n=1 Tax=Calocera cornea HHB12733 TaxID=1353952 RepID=A0A165FT25_9BASI|nr:hypothetical protein CALCODRAFT_290841 [Calocera cornea HHB12733]
MYARLMSRLTRFHRSNVPTMYTTTIATSISDSNSNSDSDSDYQSQRCFPNPTLNPNKTKQNKTKPPDTRTRTRSRKQPKNAGERTCCTMYVQYSNPPAPHPPSLALSVSLSYQPLSNIVPVVLSMYSTIPPTRAMLQTHWECHVVSSLCRHYPSARVPHSGRQAGRQAGRQSVNQAGSDGRTVQHGPTARQTKARHGYSE